MTFQNLRRHHYRTVVTSLLCVVMLFGALAPGVTRWLQSRQLDVVELCTVHGVEQVFVDGQGGHAPGKPDVISGEVCPFCSPAHPSLGLPALGNAPVRFTPLVLLRVADPQAAHVVWRLPHSRAYPRAPPQLI